MAKSTLNAVKNDMHTLVEDALALFKEAGSATTDKAIALRDQGVEMLNSIVTKTTDLQQEAIDSGKKIAACAEDYVQKNPWKFAAMSVSVSLIAALWMVRDKE